MEEVPRPRLDPPAGRPSESRRVTLLANANAIANGCDRGALARGRGFWLLAGHERGDGLRESKPRTPRPLSTPQHPRAARGAAPAELLRFCASAVILLCSRKLLVSALAGVGPGEIQYVRLLVNNPCQLYKL